MTIKKNEQTMSLQVTEGLTVTILPDSNHEFLMTTKEVAIGYDTTKYAIFKAHSRNLGDFKEHKHYVKGVDILSTPRIQPTAMLWTKAGIIRLGFFIKSERAKLFRDWAEELILNLDQLQKVEPKKQLPAKRNHNRLTQERMVSILADVCRIDDRDLRLSITNKLIGGHES